MSAYKLTIEGNDPEQIRVDLLKFASALREVQTSVHVSTEPINTDMVSATVTSEPVIPTVIKPHVTIEPVVPTVIKARVLNESFSSCINEIDTKSDSAPKSAEISLATIRAHLAKLTKDGRASEVVAALEALGCTRLTDVKPAHYATLLTSLGVPHE